MRIHTSTFNLERVDPTHTHISWQPHRSRRWINQIWKALVDLFYLSTSSQEKDTRMFWWMIGEFVIACQSQMEWWERFCIFRGKEWCVFSKCKTFCVYFVSQNIHFVVTIIIASQNDTEVAFSPWQSKRMRLGRFYLARLCACVTQYRRTAMVLQEMRLWCRNSEQHKPLDVTNREMCGRHTMVWLMKWRLCAFGTRKEIVSMRHTICDSSEGRICFGLVWGVCTERQYFSAGREFFDIATPSIKLHNNILSSIKSRSDPGIPTHQLHLVPRLQPLYVPSLPRHLLYL